ncbi:hypothetical protein [Paraburkholderia ginsengiterrae]|nr:hypothetical protein [Paraburkholderia ginsengiterrae]
MSTVAAAPIVSPHAAMRLYQWVKGFAPPAEKLRWVHTTDAFAFRAILEQRVLTPQECKVFGDPLTYLFYGRPAYRFNRRDNMRSSYHAPVVLIFRERILDHTFRLFPFDTGAFKGKRYDTWLHKGMELESFEYPGKEGNEGKHVTAFYGGNHRYWNGEGIAIGNISGEYEVEAVRDMISDKNMNVADDRRLVVELLVKDDIPLTADYLEAIYVPSSIKDAEFLKIFEKDVNVSVYTYPANGMKPAIEYQALLEHFLSEFHEDMGAL